MPKIRPKLQLAGRAGSLLLRAALRFSRDGLDQISASLAFTTLLSLVPIAALMLAIVARVPSFSAYVDHIEGLLAAHLLPPGSAKLISGRILQYSHRAAEVSWLGAAILAISALVLANTIESAFNHVWRVTPRPWWRRLFVYFLMIAVWPLLVGGLLAGISHTLVDSLGLIGDLRGVRIALFKFVSLLVLMVFFAALYHAVPNAPVRWRDAAAGGAFAALSFALLQRFFELYLAYSPSYRAVYGTFAVVPIFLLWVYLSWAIVLLGAVLTAILPESGSAPAGKRRKNG